MAMYGGELQMSGFYLECTYISWCASILDLSLVREYSVGGGGGEGGWGIFEGRKLELTRT